MKNIIELEGPLDERAKGTLFSLYQTIFGAVVSAEVEERLTQLQDIHLVFALNEDGHAVGYKLGYRESPDTFYSWLGGVLPDYRGQGKAAQMMAAQHQWCAQRGYRYVRTKTMNRWRAMLLLNIRSGFDVIGTYTGRDGVVKIILEKTL
jgi:GNAT superfamily N-acetyltransferase